MDVEDVQGMLTARDPKWLRCRRKVDCGQAVFCHVLICWLDAANPLLQESETPSLGSQCQWTARGFCSLALRTVLMLHTPF
mmetsp:Transcript_24049/g.61420  ORF Transcript_24049/g.61420 Transcript_24049/m.61420 type:complete len:81 (+) Transcript_24049:496-738(+)